MTDVAVFDSESVDSVIDAGPLEDWDGEESEDENGGEDEVEDEVEDVSIARLVVATRDDDDSGFDWVAEATDVDGVDAAAAEVEVGSVEVDFSCVGWANNLCVMANGPQAI